MQPASDALKLALTSVEKTSLWVAYERALESERPDALFRDPFARLLAGDDIEAVAKQSAEFSSKAQAAKFGLGDWEGFHGKVGSAVGSIISYSQWVRSGGNKWSGVEGPQ